MNSAAAGHQRLAGRLECAICRPSSQHPGVLHVTTWDSGVPTIGRIGIRNMQDSLTVRQSVLERVDAVENDDTWKGDLSEQTSTGKRLGRN